MTQQLTQQNRQLDEVAASWGQNVGEVAASWGQNVGA